MKPAVLAAIDAALETHLAKGIRAACNSDVLHEAQVHLDEGVGSLMAVYRGVKIGRSLAQIPDGFVVRTLPGFEKPDEQPRDPETGQFLPWDAE